jgi:hypothetical protein
MTDYYILFWAVIAISCGIPFFRRLKRNVYLRPTKFWELVGTQEKPVVLLTTKGMSLTKHCYVFPQHGIFFHTDLSQTKSDRPDDVIIIKTGRDFTLF